VDAEEEVQVPAHDDVDQENVTEEFADDVAQPTSSLPPSPVVPFAKPAVFAISTPINAAKPAAKPKVLKIVPVAPAVLTRK
nr:hypothetical protein [Tanacetum cinerariifolium]